MSNLTKGDAVRVLMIGDVVGWTGREVLIRHLGRIREEYSIDFVIANEENATNGLGVSAEHYVALSDAGVDATTLGDHAFAHKSIFAKLDDPESHIIRPANFPDDAPGRGWMIHEIPGNADRPAVPIAVMSLLGRVFITQPIDNPMTTIDKLLERVRGVKIRFLDFHAEATSEVQMMGRYLDGRVTAVLGTHTHVATADETIFPGGTAFQCDVGMTGAFESIIGSSIAKTLASVRTFRSRRELGRKDPGINGAIVDVDPLSGKALAIQRLFFKENVAP
ncbi:MAG: TIGR00282 family metallophosphoesterase [Thermoguttaceae bacterium]|jgi:metallophosphoesterase (TIGR00282 family)